MKKLFTVLALALMTVMMAVTVAGCGNSAPTKEDFDALKNRVEELEEQNKNLNVFRTDKKTYSETETMTIYFRDTAVYKIKLRFDTFSGVPFQSGGGPHMNAYLYLTGLCSDINTVEIIGGTFLESDEGVYLLSSTYTSSVIKKDIETQVGASYTETSNEYKSISRLDFVICVPGTHVELARFKNVSFEL
ncbi:MAG: hypothetical protein K2G44_05500 [Clostridia bacterium]|nr:hypothetical protein [Clostridia bacterium]